MNTRIPVDILDALLALPSENEWVEFKSVKGSNYGIEDIGRYFSALSNEAFLNKQSAAWLVFGVDNRRKVVGTRYAESTEIINKLKQGIYEKSNQLTFRDIHEINTGHGRVLLFEVPPAKPGNPTSWNGHWYGRNGESLAALTADELDRINNPIPKDWSREICPQATLDDLEPNAIAFGRKQFASKNPHLAGDMKNWDNKIFLNKAKLTLNGAITHAALLLLGKEESAHLLEPAHPKITWQYRENHEVVQHEHFYPPFILQSDRIWKLLPNHDIRFMPDGTLFPESVKQYDEWVVREALHNCIAHQDYPMGGKINIVQKADELILSNLGAFIPESLENVLANDAPPEYYRNQFLANAMVQVRMIDTLGSGVRKIFLEQKKRRFPMPDYDLSESKRVIVRIYGKIIDAKYTQILLSRSDLDLETVVLLDKVQKKRRIGKSEATDLRQRRLVEGRYPNLFPSQIVSSITDQKAAYIKNKGLDDEFYRELIVKLVSEQGPVSRKEIDQLLMDKLPDILSISQKNNKVRTYLNALVRKGRIVNHGSKKIPQWCSSEPEANCRMDSHE